MGRYGTTPGSASSPWPLTAPGEERRRMDPDRLSACGRFAALWLSPSARVVVHNCLRVVVLLVIARAGASARAASWHQVMASLALPAICLTPSYAPLSNALPKRSVLVGSAASCLAVVSFFRGA